MQDVAEAVAIAVSKVAYDESLASFTYRRRSPPGHVTARLCSRGWSAGDTLAPVRLKSFDALMGGAINSPSWQSLMWTAVLIGVVFAAGLTRASTQPTNDAASPSFLRVGQCYRLTFPIAGAPTWKVLNLVGGGWVRAEVDAGSPSGREPVWVNTTQVVTAREARCSQ